MAKLQIGTSGFNYRHWRGVLYPKGLPQSKWLERYNDVFDSVELNVSFYRLPNKKTFTSWRDRTADDFTFALKGSRFITHVKRLSDSEEPVKRFFDYAGALGPKLEVVLWQLPPSMKKDGERLSSFCELLNREAAHVRHCFEFRNEEWFDEGIYGILREHGLGLCIADSPKRKSPKVITSDFIYLRFHGGRRLYASEYTGEELKRWVEWSRGAIEEGKDLYAYFNNDALGFAVKNALTFRETLAYELKGRNVRKREKAPV